MASNSDGDLSTSSLDRNSYQTPPTKKHVKVFKFVADKLTEVTPNLPANACHSVAEIKGTPKAKTNVSNSPWSSVELNSAGIPGRKVDTIVVDRWLVRDNQILIAILCQSRAYEKRVTVRYSFDLWQTVHELDAWWQRTVAKSIDRFVANIEIPQLEANRAHAVFAVRYISAGVENWDNNCGQDHHVHLTNTRSTSYDR